MKYSAFDFMIGVRLSEKEEDCDSSRHLPLHIDY